MRNKLRDEEVNIRVKVNWQRIIFSLDGVHYNRCSQHEGWDIKLQICAVTLHNATQTASCDKHTNLRVIKNRWTQSANIVMML